MNRISRADGYAVFTLLILCLLFFWRILTPIEADQASFKQGDFSGQFVAFGAYQYQRFSAGEVPLWNPYNNGGFPFIADTQAAVFYPLRLFTILISSITGGWSYASLQYEAVLHVFLFTLFTYLFIRRLTGNTWGALVGAVLTGYSGFITGYPPLQLALLEAAIWLPLVLLGILEATNSPAAPKRWFWIWFSGVALGISWLAGHPQTSWFMTIFSLAWLVYRTWHTQMGLSFLLRNTALLGVISFGTTAVTFLPSAEYLLFTSRTGLSFAEKGNGFPFADLIQILIPGLTSVYSPLYMGIPALILLFAALRSNWRAEVFWISGAVIALIHSFGANTALYSVLYNFLPGLRFFRGQERAAFIFMVCAAILAGIGVSRLHTLTAASRASLTKFAAAVTGLLALISLISAVLWLNGIGSSANAAASAALFSTIIAAVMLGFVYALDRIPARYSLIAIVVLIAFELFTVTIDSPATYDSLPAARQVLVQPADLLSPVQAASQTEQPFRVDGFRGLRDNYGSMMQLMDIRGISPLFLDSAQKIIYEDYISSPIAWELFAVRYIFSERDSLSAAATSLLGQGADKDGTIYLHEILDPRPFAHLVYQADILDGDEFARELLHDPRYQPRQSIILQDEIPLNLPDASPEGARTFISIFEPEYILVEVTTPTDAVLSLSLVHYPGWQAFLDNNPVEILRAYGALSAVAIPSGEHVVELRYDPISYRIGLGLSLLTWSLSAILAVIWYRNRHRNQEVQE